VRKRKKSKETPIKKMKLDGSDPSIEDAIRGVLHLIYKAKGGGSII